MPARDPRPPSLSIYWTQTRKLLTWQERVDVSCIGIEAVLSPQGVQLVFQGRGITIEGIHVPGAPKYPTNRRSTDGGDHGGQ